MAEEPIQIKRYPNRRFYARNTSKYVTLPEIEQMIRDGRTIEVRDSQSDEEITHAVLTQIILERQPEKIALFPVAMLHSIVRSNEVMSDFLRDYFRHSLTYLDYLQKHGTVAGGMANPMHWVKAWMEAFKPANGTTAPATKSAATGPSEAEATASANAAELAERIAELEERIQQLESAQGPI
jgi:polyhydroxyalkanoate synthesis repressor PhaR